MNEHYNDLSNIGNFTKNAIKDFEKNIVNKTNYLESVQNNSKFENNYTIKENKK